MGWDDHPSARVPVQLTVSKVLGSISQQPLSWCKSHPFCIYPHVFLLSNNTNSRGVKNRDVSVSPKSSLTLSFWTDRRTERWGQTVWNVHFRAISYVKGLEFKNEDFWGRIFSQSPFVFLFFLSPAEAGRTKLPDTALGSWDHAPIPREVLSITQWLQVSGDMLVSLQNIFSFGRQNQISPWRRRRRMELLATRALPHLVQCLQAKSASSTNLASHS